VQTMRQYDPNKNTTAFLLKSQLFYS
jgi:hypothetical protein